MKRLLAYLFIVFGLGLAFNVNANAKSYCASADFVEIYDWSCSSSNWAPHFKKYAPTIKLNKKIYFLMREVPRRVVKELKKKKKRTGKNHDHLFYDLIYKYRSEIYEENKHQLVAKKEPSQIIKTYNWFALAKHPKTNKEFIATNVSNEKDAKRIAISKCYKYVTSQLNNRGYNDCYVDLTVDGNKNIQLAKKIISKQNSNNSISLTTNDSFNGDYKWNGKTVSKTVFCSNAEAANMPKYYPEKYILMCKTQTQIAKAEPSQTQKVASASYGDPLCVLQSYVNFVKNDSTFCKGGMKQIFVKKHGMYDYYYSKLDKTQIAKKKTKVIKVEEPKQEEFKPENKDIDNDAPIIDIAQNIIVSDTSYVIEGKVSDNSDKIFVEIDGQPIEVRKGKFKAKRYSPVDEQVKIVAIDQWGNKSKPKIVNIKINIKETVVAENLEPLNPSNIRTKSSNEKIAIIIGIENYSEAPKANYANLDAQYFFDYARKAFGVKKQNINLLINENATVVKTDKALSLWLKSKIKKNRSDLIIFFAGHGLASTDGKELYLLPQDGNPDRLERTALSRTDLLREIIELNPRNVTMFLDTCYSGVSRDEQMLLASARPIRIVADEQDGIPDNFTIFSASKLDQISSGLKEAKHGIFSYYLMKGLEGYADFNEDKKITNGELLAYMDENVSQKAAEQGREQNPSLAGDPDKVLISYR